MKKFLIISLLVLPVTAMAASSVRMLGAGASANPATVQKVTPSKATATTNSVATSRIGTLRATPKVSGSAISGTSSRFPVISTAHSYKSVATPSNNVTPTTVPANVDVDAIVNAVTQRIENNYYNKNEVYNNNNFLEAVKDVDDPRIDAIKVGSRPVHTEPLPSDYVYIWIEQ